MDRQVVERDRLNLEDNPVLLSPPWLFEPLYQCATTVTVFGFVAHADIDVEVDGSIVISETVGFPEPVGATLALPTPLVAGQVVRVRQRHTGRTSAWSNPVEVRDHTLDYPAGPPRPQIDPAPVYKCGSRTGVTNLLGGGNVWITADGSEVGRVNGCAAPKQGVNVNPFYGLGQRVRAHFELCGDEAAPSVEHIAQPGPSPLPTPGFDDIYEGGEQLRITQIANGARVSLTRNGSPAGTYRCWGGALLVGLVPAFSAGEIFTATQQLCPSDPSSPPGGGTVQPCSALAAPDVGPIQAGDQKLVITKSVPGAQIRVYRNFVQVGLGGAPVVLLTQTLLAGDIVHVVQALGGCVGHLVLQITVACVDPPYTGDPSSLDIFPVGYAEYADAAVRGSVYYPADDDGKDQPFNTKLAGTGRVPIVVMAHGNHDPADPSYLGYDYFQHSLAKMGVIAVSVDCNALNGWVSGVGNIEDRADLIIDSIRFFQDRDADPGSIFFERIDFSRLGLMGHSRGGDAAVTIPTVMPAIGVKIRAVLALAPTNFRYWSGMSTIHPSGYAFQTILPASDGDVTDNNGAQFYDQADPNPYKSQVYVDSTNHNFFNRQWLSDDGVTPVLARGDHEDVLDAYGCAIFRSQLLGHPTHVFLDGRQRPSTVPAGVAHLSFKQEGQSTVDDHEDGNTIGFNSLSRPTTQSGGMVADEYPFDQVAGSFNPSFFGMTVGMVMQPRETGGVFRSETGVTDLRDLEIWLRVAEVAQTPLPADATGFQLGVEDTTGITAWVDSDAVGGVPRPFERPDRTKTMLNTLRFHTGCFRTVQPSLNLKQVEAILIRYNRPVQQRALAFDDLQLVQPLPGG